MQLEMKVFELEEQSVENTRLKTAIADYNRKLENQEHNNDLLNVKLEEALNLKDIQDKVFGYYLRVMRLPLRQS